MILVLLTGIRTTLISNQGFQTWFIFMILNLVAMDIRLKTSEVTVWDESSAEYSIFLGNSVSLH